MSSAQNWKLAYIWCYFKQKWTWNWSFIITERFGLLKANYHHVSKPIKYETQLVFLFFKVNKQFPNTFFDTKGTFWVALKFWNVFPQMDEHIASVTAPSWIPSLSMIVNTEWMTHTFLIEWMCGHFWVTQKRLNEHFY